MIKFKVKVMLALRGMTQKELAEKTGIRPPTVSAICVGTVKHLPVDALEKICDVLDCQPADLIEYVREPDGVFNKTSAFVVSGTDIQKAANYPKNAPIV